VVGSGMMHRLSWVAILGLAIMHSSLAQNSVSVEKAAMKYVPGMDWQRRSIVSGNFSCHGRKEQAILGVSASEIVIAVFVNGLDVRPELLRYSGKARNPKTAELKIEDLDYDPKEMIGSDLDGFKRSKSCKGLNLSDGETDSAHIYWNHKSQRFEDWTL
jgi:hypothetical protein